VNLFQSTKKVSQSDGKVKDLSEKSEIWREKCDQIDYSAKGAGSKKHNKLAAADKVKLCAMMITLRRASIGNPEI